MTGESSELKPWIEDCLAQAIQAGRLTTWPVRALVYTAEHVAVVQFTDGDSRVIFNPSQPGEAWRSPVFLVFADAVGNVAAASPEVASLAVPRPVDLQ